MKEPKEKNPKVLLLDDNNTWRSENRFEFQFIINVHNRKCYTICELQQQNLLYEFFLITKPKVSFFRQAQLLTWSLLSRYNLFLLWLM